MSCFGGGDESDKEQSRKNKAINDQLKKDKDVYKSTHRLLLLGELEGRGVVSNGWDDCMWIS